MKQTRFKLSNRRLIALFALLFLALCAGSLALYRMDSGGSVANIYQDGVCIRSIPLSTVTGTQSFTITDDEGHENTIEIENGRIRMLCANCPDQVCVETGWVSSSLKPIVCLPARLVIQLDSDAVTEDLALDAVSG